MQRRKEQLSNLGMGSYDLDAKQKLAQVVQAPPQHEALQLMNEDANVQNRAHAHKAEERGCRHEQQRQLHHRALMQPS